ncbi:helix-turn-helix domain-containing protein [Pannonibacter tanglangensis]|uniref:Helix-turn-helix domain-containing protein n=1 Tax=Pannonibacter tanglangensis TaxID=2750084 RepID=A0ABW9ZMC0_9HYPH|nr:helix-turn-helix transcriptional regulator [Pannonibacter sp. XCT-34]NBN64169.1 helix-turn-helix domain-containing protein [Pannonibacter sp. XCT-34]
MAPDTPSQPSKQPRRPHYIREWAELAGYASQAELANALDADKSVVSRWYNGASPSLKMQQRLACLLGCEPDALFRRPIDEWMMRFLQGRSADEVRRIKQVLLAAFPIDPNGAGER